MKKLSVIALTIAAMSVSACTGVSQARIESSNRVERMVMTPPPPSNAQCVRARMLARDTLAPADAERRDDTLRRCDAPAAR